MNTKLNNEDYELILEALSYLASKEAAFKDVTKSMKSMESPFFKMISDKLEKENINLSLKTEDIKILQGKLLQMRRDQLQMSVLKDDDHEKDPEKKE